MKTIAYTFLFTLVFLIIYIMYRAPVSTPTKVTEAIQVDATLPSHTHIDHGLTLITRPVPKTPVKKEINTRLKSVPLKSTPPPLQKKWQGPKSFNLGTQSITLRSLDWRVHINVVLTTDQADTYQMFRPLRKRMIQMLYFLVSHRVARALQLDSGEERLRKDLSTRFHNLLRNREFDVDFEQYELEKVEDVPVWEDMPKTQVGKKQDPQLQWEENTESLRESE